MNISVKSEYALKAIFDLASQYAGTSRNSVMPPVKIADIARRQKFLELILAGLKQNGFVDSRRGAEGGYLLARPPESITIGEVLRAVENLRSGAHRHNNDPFGEIWNRVDSAMADVLDKTSFGELVRRWHEKNNQYIPNWDI